MEWTSLHVPVHGGIDTNTDPKQVQPPKVLELENGHFRIPGSVEKRPGMALIASKDADLDAKDIRGIAARGEELVMFDGDRLWKPAPDPAGGTQLSQPSVGAAGALDPSVNAGSLSSLARITQRQSAKLDLGVVGSSADMASADIGGSGKRFTIHVVNVGGLSYFSVLSEEDGSTLAGPYQITSSTFARVVAVNSGGVSSALIMFRVAAGGGSLRAFNVNGSNFLNPDQSGVGYTTIATGDVAGAFDAEANGLNIYYAYISTTANTIKYGIVDVNPTTVLAATTQATASAPNAVCVAANSYDGDFAVCWTSTAGSRVDGRVYNLAGTALGAAFQIEATGSLTFNQIAAVYEEESASYTTPRIGVFYSVQGAARSNDHVRRGLLYHDGSGGQAGAVLVRHVGIASRAWRGPTRMAGQQSNNFHIVLSRSSAIQKTHFLYRVSVVDGNGTTASGKQAPTSIDGYLAFGVAVDHALVSDGMMAGGIQVLDSISRWCGVANGRCLEYRMDDTMPLRSAEMGEALYWAGGFVGAYDGARAMEAAFFLNPEIWTLTPSAAGGSLTVSTTYTYRVFYVRRTVGGKKIISGAVQKTAATGVADTRIVLEIETIAQLVSSTANHYDNIEIYRGIGDSPGVICRLVGTVVTLPTQDTITHNDDMSDATLASQPQDYLSGTPMENQNYAPMACSAMALINGRVWINQYDDDNLVLFSKERLTGEPLAFAGENRLVLQAGSGPVVAFGQMGDDTVIFREREILVVAGRGPDNTGGDGQYDDPVLVSSDVGCINPESVVNTKMGVYFESHRGIMLLTREGMVEPIGAEVIGYRTDVIKKAVASAKEAEVFFVTNNRTLLYDSDAKAWGTWTIPGDHACLWQDRVTIYRASTGKVYAETTGYLDEATAYTFKLVSAWIPIEGLNGAERIRRALVQGVLRGDHRAQVWFAYDFIDTWYGPFTWTRIASSSYNFTIHPGRQRVTAIKVKFQDLHLSTSAAPEASMGLSQITLEGTKMPSPVRLGTTRKAT